MVLNFSQYISEALKLSDARKATELFLKSGGKQRYDEIFKGKDRLYYDFFPYESKKLAKSKTQIEIEGVLSKNGYYVADYIKGLATKEGDSKNVFKIQKILNSLGESKLKNAMDKDEIRFGAKKADKKVVISRHGIDLAGQSTGRGWSSCKDLKDGINKRYVWSEIEGGSLVAYLIEANDLNIQKPIARILMGVFVNVNDPSDFVVYPDTSIYGHYNLPDFPDFVKNWCDEFNYKISKRGDKTSIYSLSPSCYSDNRQGLRIYGGTLSIEDLLSTIDPDFSRNPQIGGYRDVNTKVSKIKQGEAKNLVDVIVEVIPKHIRDKDLKSKLKKLLSDLKKYLTEKEYAEVINANSEEKILDYLKDPQKLLVFNFYLKGIKDFNSFEDKNKMDKIKNGILESMMSGTRTLEELKKSLRMALSSPHFIEAIDEDQRRIFTWLIS